MFTTAVITKVDALATNQTLLAENPGRTGFRLYNDSDSLLYVKYGATATSDDLTVPVLPRTWLVENLYRGIVDGLWVTATGKARITSIT